MKHLSAHGDGCADVLPSRDLADREDVSCAQEDVSVSGSRQCRCDIDADVLANHLGAIFEQVASQIRRCRIGASLHASSKSDQIGGVHANSERISAGARDFALNSNRRRIHFREILMDENSVFRLQQEIVFLVASERLFQIDVEYFKFPVIRFAEDLGIGQERIWSRASGKIDGIAKVGGTIGDMVSGVADFAANGDERLILEVKSAENPDRVERLQRYILVRSAERLAQIERYYRRSVVRRRETNYFRVLLVRFRQHVVV